ncbi:ADP-ribosylglycohydrolase family protein [Pseudarthrobacter sp. R1]|uniref:ADP-ribosylglycohydrolase family protein n=1 Tax=Pseudarthrobacter sp. R1 TaxID=2944934 RepID=UPI00210B2234|nr:ADP-ribosylglycohydrolase family protein [Pseudarthrobacter sp. R1]MCQ6272289.1 ADP-ribosylglycohydrolase family protein [Pseudarthrobacter sp. R1]
MKTTTPVLAATDRAFAALLGLAVGVAGRMPTQSMRREAIRARYGQLAGFVAASDDQPIAPGMPAGSVTDDTEQAVLVAELLLSGGGRIEAGSFASTLLTWEQSMIDKGSRDLLGPSTKASLNALQSGQSIEEAGRYGTTNGAAMRITPVGIMYRRGPRLMSAVVEACQVTHNTGLGISAAAAIAAGVSAGIDGAEVPEALDAAIDAALAGQTLGHWVAGASVAQRYLSLHQHARSLGNDQFADFLYDVVGTSVQSQESVVSALLIIDRFRDDPFEGLCAAASLGGDTDTIAAIAGAVLGACSGSEVFPASVQDQLIAANPELELQDLSARLIEVRQ